MKEIILTNKDIAIIKYGVLPKSGTRRWMLLTRSLKQKLNIENEASILQLMERPEGASMAFINEDAMFAQVTVQLNNEEIEFLKEIVSLIDEKGGYTEFNIDTLDLIKTF